MLEAIATTVAHAEQQAAAPQNVRMPGLRFSGLGSTPASRSVSLTTSPPDVKANRVPPHVAAPRAPIGQRCSRRIALGGAGADGPVAPEFFANSVSASCTARGVMEPRVKPSYACRVARRAKFGVCVGLILTAAAWLWSLERLHTPDDVTPQQLTSQPSSGLVVDDLPDAALAVSMAEAVTHPPEARVAGAVGQTPPDAAVPRGNAAWSEEQELSLWLEWNADLAERTVDTFCRAAALRDRPLFPPEKHADASAFFAPLIDWEATPGQPPKRGTLALPQPTRDHLRQLGTGTWLNALTAADAFGLDFLWMRQAQQFDHWDLSRDPYFAGDETTFSFHTIPNFEPFQQWSKLRLAIALQQGDASQAAAEVRHLADLCASTESPIGVLIGVALRSMEARTRETAVARGHEMSAWPEISEAQLDAYRSLRHAHFFFYPGVSTRAMKRAASCLGPQRCVWLVEGLGAHLELGKLASNDTTAALESLIGEKNCRGGSLDLAKQAHSFTPQQVHQIWADDLLPGLRPGRSSHPLERFLDAPAR
jgi:hypothetical protein